MSIEDSLGTALAAQASITATVTQTTLNNGIVPDQQAEGTAFPRIIYRKTGDVPFYTDAGVSVLSRATFEIECQGTTISDAEAVRTAVKNYLSGLSGPASLGTNKVNRCFITDDYDTPYPSIHGNETGVRAKTIEIEMDYT